jgi:hypothetical protein
MTARYTSLFPAAIPTSKPPRVCVKLGITSWGGAGFFGNGTAIQCSASMLSLQLNDLTRIIRLLIPPQEPSRPKDILYADPREVIGVRGEHIHVVIVRGNAVIASGVILEVEGLSRSNVCSIWRTEDLTEWASVTWISGGEGDEGRSHSGEQCPCG